MHTERYWLNLERRGCRLTKFKKPKTSGRLGMHHDPDAFDFGRDLLEKPNPFSGNRTLPIGESCEVAVGTRFVANKTGTDRIADAYENNRYSADFSLNNRRHQISIGDQHVWCETHQLRNSGSCPAGVRRRKANVNADIAPFVPPQILQFLTQRRDLSLSCRIGLGIPYQHADASHAIALLRVCSYRPSHRATKSTQNVPSPHCRPRGSSHCQHTNSHQCSGRLCPDAADVRFTPNSDRKSGLPQTVMSALPPKADMCTARAHVRFGPKADILAYSITSPARASTAGGTVRPSAFAVLRLMTNAYLVAVCTGRSAGFSPLRMRST